MRPSLFQRSSGRKGGELIIAPEGFFVRDVEGPLKNSEIARYWAARELTKIEKQGGRITFNAPFATTRFTVRSRTSSRRPPKLIANRQRVQLRHVNRPLQLQSQTWHKDGRNVTVCFDLPKGKSTLDV